MYFPLFIKLSGKKVLVIGLGKVGKRRALKLRDAGAHVTGIDRKVKRVRGIEFQRRDLNSRDIPPLNDYFLVVTATDDKKLNETITNKAMKAGALVNRADDFKDGDVIFPATLRVNGGLLAFTTFGRSPGISKFGGLKNTISANKAEKA